MSGSSRNECAGISGPNAAFPARPGAQLLFPRSYKILGYKRLVKVLACLRVNRG
jgi:hypothetical protein